MDIDAMGDFPFMVALVTRSYSGYQLDKPQIVGWAVPTKLYISQSFGERWAVPTYRESL